MSISLHELLQPAVILDVVSRLREGQGRLGRWLGWHPNRYDPKTVTLSGPNTLSGETRYASFRIYDHTRVVAKARAPGTGPATVPPNPVGDVPVRCARFHEKITLLYEDLGNLSPIVGPQSTVDTGGQDYCQRQIRTMAIKFNNAVELMASGFMQDNLYFLQSGDNWLPVLGQPSSGVYFQVPFQIPAGNKSQLNMLGTGDIITTPWNNPGAPIYGQISAIKAAFAQLTGYALNHVWVNSLMWYNIITNTELRNIAGSSAMPFAEFDKVPERGMDGLDTGEYEAVLKADPTIRWHINDQVLVTNSDIDPSYSTAPAGATIIKVVPDNMAFFTTEPSPLWNRLYLGAEHVVENPGQPAVLRKGYYFWREYVTQPSAVELLGLLNAIPLLFVPKLNAPATVVF